MSYRPLGNTAPVPTDDASVLALMRGRGFVAIPTLDVQRYVQAQLVTVAVGFGIGVGVGALFGNVLRDRKLPKVLANRRRRRRRRS